MSGRCWSDNHPARHPPSCLCEQKSTRARALGKHLGLPVVHLETLFLEPG